MRNFGVGAVSPLSSLHSRCSIYIIILVITGKPHKYKRFKPFFFGMANLKLKQTKSFSKVSVSILSMKRLYQSFYFRDITD